MVVKFNCTCGQSLQVGDELAGKRARCPFCYKVLDVPTAVSSATAPSGGSVETAAPVPTAVPEPPSSTEKTPISPLPYVAVAVIALVIVVGVLVWWNALREPSIPPIPPPPKITEKRVPTKVVPPKTAPTKEAPAIVVTPPTLPPGKTTPTPPEKTNPVMPPVTPPIQPPPPPAGKVTIEPPTPAMSFEPGQNLGAELGARITAIIVAQVEPLVDTKAAGVRPIAQGTALSAVVDGNLYAGEVFRPFYAYVSNAGKISLKRFYVETTSPWAITKDVTIPAGVQLQFGEDSRFLVAPTVAPPTPPAPPTAPPAPELPPELPPI